jgi:hypothetical protein
VVPRLIGLYSPAPQSGKSTIAKHLVKAHGYQRRGFAAPLKEMIHTLMRCAGMSEAEIADYSEPRKEEVIQGPIGASFRRLAQTLGTDWGRKLIQPNLWVDVAMRAADTGSLTVFDDLRFENEYRTIKAAGGVVWKILRPSAEHSSGHQSEGLLDHLEFDRVLVNSGSVQDLFDQLPHYPRPSDNS